MQSSSRKQAVGKDGLNLRPILDVVKKINSERNLRRLVTTILDTAIELSNAGRGSLAIFKGDRFNAELSRDRIRGEITHSEIPALRSILKLISGNGKLIVIDDARNDARVPFLPEEKDRAPLSILCLPLRVKSRLLGAVYLDNTDQANAFGPRELEFAEILSEHASIAIENALLYRRSTQDRVTSLFNHGAFEQQLDEEIDRARRQNTSCGLLMIDVDDFKQINDLYGHEVGNDVLRNVAYTLSTTVRGADIVGRIQNRPQPPVVGRYGGDEFEIILPGVSREGALTTAKRLATLFKGQKFMSGDKRLKMSVSIGIAVFPFDAKDAHELLLRADEALYQSKRAGKGHAILCKGPERPRTGTIPVQSSPRK